jgi:hypothetical protein
MGEDGAWFVTQILVDPPTTLATARKYRFVTSGATPPSGDGRNSRRQLPFLGVKRRAAVKFG